MKISDAVARVRAVLDLVCSSPTHELEVAELRTRISDLAGARAAIEALELDAAERLRSLGAGHAEIADEFVSSGGRSAREAGRIETRAGLCAELPALHNALAVGAISGGHIDAVARGLRNVGEESKDSFIERVDDLVAEASVLSVDDFSSHVRGVVKLLQHDAGLSQLDRQRRATELRTWTDDDGMILLRGRFDPERGIALLGRLNRQIEATFHAGIDVSPAPGIQRNDHLRALALLDLVCGNGSGTSTDMHSQDGLTTSRAEVLVVIDWDTLRHGVSATSTVRGGFGLDLPVETVRRMACDAGIIPVVMNGAGEVLDVGRAKRLASPAQRKALYAMHSTCAINECQVKIEHCVPHHIDYWESGGSTDMSNLVPLCSRHHHAAHEGGWKLKLEAGHKLTVEKPTAIQRC